MDANGENQTRITTNTAIDANADWSPQGSQITFTSFRDGHYEIYTMNADGSNQDRLTYSNVHAIQPAWRPEITIGIDKEDTEGIPQKTGSLHVFPNPVKSSTTIGFSVKDNSYVSLKIYDLFGKEAKTLIDGNQTDGLKTITWDCTDNAGQTIPAGVYFCRYRTGNQITSRKMIVM